MDQSTKDQGFAAWCLIELFGHSRLAGYLSEQQIGGQTFIRVDVPETESAPAYSKFYGAAAIYSFTPVDEEIARGMAERLNERPISIYEMSKILAQTDPEPSLLTEPTYDYQNDDEPQF